MIEVKNIEVFDLERAKRAIKNSYNVGEINTLEGEFAKGAKNLGSNMQPCQSHDAWLAGIVTTFEMICDDYNLIFDLSSNKFIEINKLNENSYLIKTNYRCLKHLILNFINLNKHHDFINIIKTFQEFKEICFYKSEELLL